MPQYRVINAYVERGTGKRRNPGETVTVSEHAGSRMAARRLVVPIDRQRSVETTTRKPTETTAARTDAPKHVGGGWYELPSGERVQGRETAEERMKQQ